MAGTQSAVVMADAMIQVKKTGVHLSAEITGVDLTAPLDQATVQAISAAHAEHQVVVFRGQNLSGDQLRALGRNFGELSVHPFSTNDPDTPELIVFDNHPDNPPHATDVWHADETYKIEPPMGTLLNSKEIPPLGGDTVFASMTAAYEGLSDRMQRFISGLEAVHDFKPFKKLFGDSPQQREKLQHYERLYPPATHPVVSIHPVTKKKVLYVNPQFALYIKGMDERESRQLLDTLFHQILIPEYQYRHHWEDNMLVYWDNRSVLHYAVHDYYPQRRRLNRITLNGVRPQGVKRANPAELHRAKMPMPNDKSRMAPRQHTVD